jgi:hypothetical protein
MHANVFAVRAERILIILEIQVIGEAGMCLRKLLAYFNLEIIVIKRDPN